MEIIVKLCDFIEDELEGVEEYAEMATEYKSENKELGDMFYTMATNEMTHLKNLHGWLVKFIDKVKKEKADSIPKGMLTAWAREHRKMIERFNKADIVLQNYQKL